MKVASVLLALVCLAPVAGKEKDRPPPPLADDKIVVLEPFKVTGSPIISFAIDIVVYGNPKTKKVNRIFIDRVVPDTDAERAGLQAGDEIVKLDGVAVKDMDAEVSRDSGLGKIFLNRTPGEPLKLEVITRRTEHFTLRAQRDRPGAHFP